MSEASPVTSEDIQATLEGYSFTKSQAIQLFMGGCFLLAGWLFISVYAVRALDGEALIEEMPWLIPTVTLFQILLAVWLWRRDQRFAQQFVGADYIDPNQVAALGWRSALQATPAEMCLVLYGAWNVLRLAAWATVALMSLGVLYLATLTSDLMRSPGWWINAAGFLYWWVLFFRLFPTQTRALRWFHSDLSRDSGTVQVLTAAD